MPPIQQGPVKNRRLGGCRGNSRQGATKIGICPTNGCSNAAQFGHPSAAHPIGHVDISLLVKTGVVGMDELSLFPSALVGANGKPLGFFLVSQDSLAVISDRCHSVMVAVEQRDAG